MTSQYGFEKGRQRGYTLLHISTGPEIIYVSILQLWRDYVINRVPMEMEERNLVHTPGSSWVQFKEHAKNVIGARERK